MAYAGSATFDSYHTVDPRHEAARARLDTLALLMDSAWVVPGTRIRFGMDALLNVIPVAGDVVATAVSAYLIWEARRLGAPRRMVARMAVNVGVDALISAVPVIGWVGDVFYRANLKNVRLLREHLDTLERLKAEDGSITTSWRTVR
jgi:hypothetical protein